MRKQIMIIAGPTASGKSSRAVAEALVKDAEIISVDSRQVYRGLDIGTEKISRDEMRGVPHYLIDIREPSDSYSAGDFVADASRLIEDISSRGKLPILTGGTHFYFDALINGLPAPVPANHQLRADLEKLSTEELYDRVASADSRRAKELDPKNRRRIIRALEIISSLGSIPERTRGDYEIEWVLLDPESSELRQKIESRLSQALTRGLVEETREVRERVGDARLNELGLEYRIVGEYLRGERDFSSLVPALSAKIWQYARRQRAWLRKLRDEFISAEV